MLPQETFINPVASVLLMVLEKLGSSLRDTLQKVTNALFVDEKLVNELVKDLQKALLLAGQYRRRAAWFPADVSLYSLSP